MQEARQLRFFLFADNVGPKFAYRLQNIVIGNATANMYPALSNDNFTSLVPWRQVGA